jgi:Rps23 Pro-64 3,4-dihydroxylase Tpa1-like proline 4-hydroxylase
MDILNFDFIKDNNKTIEQIDNRDIYVIRNFLEQKEIDFLYEKLESLTTEDFYNSYLEKQIKRQAMEKYGTDDLDKLVKDGVIQDKESAFNFYWADKIYFVEDLNKELKQTINNRLLSYLQTGYSFNGLNTVQRHGQGQFLGYHYDNAYEQDIKFAVAIYLNDNFDGGELHFPPEEDLKAKENGDWELVTDRLNGTVIQPHAGDLVIFSTTGDYVHGVRPVLSNNYRYAIVTFIR